MGYSFQTELDKLRSDYQADTRAKAAYLERGHSNYQKSVSRGSDVDERDAKFLYANNGYGRIKLAELLFEEMEQLVTRQGGSSVLQLTLTPGHYTFSESSTERFEPASFKRLITRNFRSVNVLGFIEPGFYPTFSGGLVSFHAHTIVWGTDPVTLRELAMPFKKRHKSIFPSRPSAYVQVVPAGDVPHVLWYQNKPPTHGYEVVGHFIESADPTTGEVISWLHPRSKSLKRKLRRGERIRVDNAIAHLLADELVVATGPEGIAMPERIKDQALADFRRQTRRGAKLRLPTEPKLRVLETLHSEERSPTRLRCTLS